MIKCLDIIKNSSNKMKVIKINDNNLRIYLTEGHKTVSIKLNREEIIDFVEFINEM